MAERSPVEVWADNAQIALRQLDGALADSRGIFGDIPLNLLSSRNVANAIGALIDARLKLRDEMWLEAIKIVSQPMVEARDPS